MRDAGSPKPTVPALRELEREFEEMKDSAVMREFGNAVFLSRSSGDEESKVVDELLFRSMKQITDHCPDLIFGQEPEIIEGPIVDILQRFKNRGIRMSFASVIYDYFHELSNEMATRRERTVISRLSHQSRKSWWTRLCWKLGGFELNMQSYEDAFNHNEESKWS